MQDVPDGMHCLSLRPCMAAGQRPRCRECHESPLTGNGAARELADQLKQHAPPAVSPILGLWHSGLLLRGLPYCHAGDGI